jgi:hypothetical protein
MNSSAQEAHKAKMQRWKDEKDVKKKQARQAQQAALEQRQQHRGGLQARDGNQMVAKQREPQLSVAGKKPQFQLQVIGGAENGVTSAFAPVTPSGAAGIASLVANIPPFSQLAAEPRKNLGEEFSNEDKTGYLTELLAGMSVATPAAKRKKKAMAMAVARQMQLQPSATLQQHQQELLPTVALGGHGRTTVITSPPEEQGPPLDGVQALKPAGVPASPMAKHGSGSKDVPGLGYFRHQVSDRSAEFEASCQRWTTALGAGAIPEETHGDVHAAIGQARLLVDKRFKQFSSLCDLNEQNGQRGPGQTARNADLDGFWEVIMMQVTDIRRTFEKLEERATLGWKEEEAKDCRAPRKRKRATDPALQRLRKSGKPGPVTPRTRAAKGRLAAIKQRMKKSRQGAHVSSSAPAAPLQQTAVAAVFPTLSPPAKGTRPAAAVSASVSILTPMRASKHEQGLHGTDFMLTPVRRSTRKTPSKYKRDPAAESDVASALAKVDFSYRPNHALAGSMVDRLQQQRQQQQRQRPSAPINFPLGEAAQVGGGGGGGGGGGDEEDCEVQISGACMFALGDDGVERPVALPATPVGPTGGRATATPLLMGPLLEEVGAAPEYATPTRRSSRLASTASTPF